MKYRTRVARVGSRSKIIVAERDRRAAVEPARRMDCGALLPCRTDPSHLKAGNRRYVVDNENESVFHAMLLG